MDDHVFIVRCWNETETTGPATWRFRVSQSDDDEVRHFSSMSDVSAFIDARLVGAALNKRS